MENEQNDSKTDKNSLPSEVDDVIAIAQNIQSNFNDHFEIVFQMAVEVYYRAKFQETSHPSR